MKSLSRFLVVLSIAVASVAVSACGEDDGPAPATMQPTSSPRPSQTSPAPTSPVSPPAASPPSGPAPTADRLTNLLLTLPDLPSGWSTIPNPSAESGDEICGREAPARRHPPAARVQAGFKQSDLGPLLTEVLVSYNGAAAAEAMTYASETVKACRTWTVAASDGSKTTWTVTQLTFPRLGDDIFAFRLSATGAPGVGTIQGDVAFVRRGTVVMQVSYITTGAGIKPDQSAVESFTRKADDRLAGLP